MDWEMAQCNPWDYLPHIWKSVLQSNGLTIQTSHFNISLSLVGENPVIRAQFQVQDHGSSNNAQKSAVKRIYLDHRLLYPALVMCVKIREFFVFICSNVSLLFTFISYVQQVQLNLGVKAYLYNTTLAYYKCTFSHGECSINVLFPEGNAAVIATPGPGQVKLTKS